MFSVSIALRRLCRDVCNRSLKFDYWCRVRIVVHLIAFQDWCFGNFVFFNGTVGRYFVKICSNVSITLDVLRVLLIHLWITDIVTVCSGKGKTVSLVSFKLVGSWVTNFLDNTNYILDWWFGVYWARGQLIDSVRFSLLVDHNLCLTKWLGFTTLHLFFIYY